MLSPSSRSIDRLLKRELYEEAGVEQSWVVDPEEPSTTVWRRGPAGFDVPQPVTGSEPLVLSDPLPMTVVPPDLLR